MTLTMVSLFDGIGGFPLAFQRAGARVIATVEIDTAAAAVTARHFPGVQQFPDVTEVSADDLRSAGFVPERGVVTAGWPCQDFSVAGRRAGLVGARSGLWWEVVRILADVRPRWFLGENVPGLLSSVCTPECDGGCMEAHGGAMGAVLGSLAELGYGVAYRVLDAQHFGVPQQRRRVFIVGHLGAPFGAAAQVLLEPEGGDGDSAPGGKTWPEVASTLMAGANETGGTRPPGTQIDTIGTLVVDDVAQAVNHDPECESRQHVVWHEGVPYCRSCGGGGGGPDIAPAVTARYGKGAESAADDALLLDGIEHTHTHNESSVDAAGRRETGLPDRRRIGSGRPSHRREVVSALTTSYCGGIGGPDDNAAQAGYLVVQPTTATGGVTHTLTSEGADASEDGTGRGTPIVVYSPDKARMLTSGTSSPGVSAPGRRQEDDHNIVVQPLAVHENQRGEITTPDVMGTLKTGGGTPGQGYPCVVQPLALRGREGGAMLEVGPEGGPYNALRAGDGGSSRQSLIAVTGVHLTQDPISSEGRAPAMGSTAGCIGVAIPVDLRNAARASGSGAGTQGDGYREDGVSYGLSATERALPGVATETVVRRLTELECERLQGYPDGWTDGQSGSARYRQLGNSVAVPVVEWLARRLVAVDQNLLGGLDD